MVFLLLFIAVAISGSCCDELSEAAVSSILPFFHSYCLLLSLTLCCINSQISKTTNPVDTGRNLNVHKTFRRRPGRLLNVLCTFNLRPVSKGKSNMILHVSGKSQTINCHAAKSLTKFAISGYKSRQDLKLNIYLTHQYL